MLGFLWVVGGGVLLFLNKGRELMGCRFRGISWRGRGIEKAARGENWAVSIWDGKCLALG